MIITVSNGDYEISIYNEKGKGFYPIIFMVALSISISTTLQNYPFTLFTAFSLGLLSISLSICRILGNFRNFREVAMEFSSLTAIEGEQINMEISFRHHLLELLVLKRISIISDIGIRVSKTSFMRAKELLSIEFLVQGYCGKHQIRGFILIFSDPFSYLNYRIEIILKNPIYIHIVPKETYVEINVERSIPYISYEAQLSKRKGLGLNILGIREYLPDDDYRRIDWKATARTLKLMVKEFERHLYRDVLFIVSIHDRFFFGEPPAVERLLKVLLNLLLRIINSGLNLGLGVVTEREIVISNKITKNNLKHIYEILSSITWPLTIERKNYSSANRIVHWFIDELSNRFCSESCLVIVFMDIIDDLDIENIKRILKELIMKRYALKIFLVQPVTIRFILSSVGMDELRDLQSELNMYKYVLSHFRSSNIISSVADLL